VLAINVSRHLNRFSNVFIRRSHLIMQGPNQGFGLHRLYSDFLERLVAQCIFPACLFDFKVFRALMMETSSAYFSLVSIGVMFLSLSGISWRLGRYLQDNPAPWNLATTQLFNIGDFRSTIRRLAPSWSNLNNFFRGAARIQLAKTTCQYSDPYEIDIFSNH